MLDSIAKYQTIVKSFQVSLYEQEGPLFRIKAEITLTNDSKVYMKEFVFENGERKYAYHWENGFGK